MRRNIIFLVACVLTALAPLTVRFASSARNTSEARGADVRFPGWLTHFDGHTLTQLPLSEREQRFGGDFPGRIARFTDGEREIIVRWVTEPTRKLHPAADCFQGIGYQVRPLPLRLERDGTRWASFVATRNDETLKVYERIYDEAGKGWTDASSWYWAATSGETQGAWWAITVAERSVQ